MIPKQYDNNLRGVLFKNDRKKTDKHPDYQGNCEIDGVEYWLSGWIKESGQNSRTPGRKFLSLSFQKKDDAGVNQDAPPRENTAPPDEEIPF